MNETPEAVSEQPAKQSSSWLLARGVIAAALLASIPWLAQQANAAGTWGAAAWAAVAVFLLAAAVAPIATLIERAVMVVILGGMIALLIPFCGGAGEAARRGQCMNNLKQIALALHNYHDEYGSFPPAYIADADGKPMHSWRVLILPYMEQQPLYDAYDFSEAWDGPNNRKLHDTIVSTYSCPSKEDRDTPTTSYVAVVGSETIFPMDQSTAFEDVTDGSANTLLVVEMSDSGIHWMEPRDLEIEEMPAVINPGEGRSRGVSSMHPDGALVALADGSNRFLPNSLPTKTLRAMLTIAGGETIDPRY